MQPKYSCEKCDRKLIDRFHDKCMYCGHPIPPKYQLTEVERESNRLEKEKIFQERKDRHKEYMRNQKSASEGLCGGSFGIGDFDGGGDC